MQWVGLACDYDGTLATHGHVGEPVVSALRRYVATGRKLLLVTGRELPELRRIFPEISLFHRVVAENGGLLYSPASEQEQLLGQTPDERFVAMLQSRGVTPMSVGRSIVATWEPHEVTVLQSIRDLGLGLQVIFNKGAVMVLPSGVSKATGLAAALKDLGISRHNVVGIGDAENDHALLTACELGVAVSNALPALKDRADWVTAADHGAGVAELIDRMLADDLDPIMSGVRRHDLLLGQNDDGSERRIPPWGSHLLLAGSKLELPHMFTLAWLEQLHRAGYQYCAIDPDGSMPALSHEVSLGTAERPPTQEEVVQALASPKHAARVVMTGLSSSRRRAFLSELLPQLAEFRSRVGRPHWGIMYQAHHMISADEQIDWRAIEAYTSSTLWVSSQPHLLPDDVVTRVGWVLFRDLERPILRPPWSELAMPGSLSPHSYLAWDKHRPDRLGILRIAETAAALSDAATARQPRTS